MTDPIVILTICLAILATITVAALAALKGWQDWLGLKRLELEGRATIGAPTPLNRIDLADLKERVRKLERIAAGIDL